MRLRLRRQKRSLPILRKPSSKPWNRVEQTSAPQLCCTRACSESSPHWEPKEQKDRCFRRTNSAFRRRHLTAQTSATETLRDDLKRAKRLRMSEAAVSGRMSWNSSWTRAGLIHRYRKHLAEVTAATEDSNSILGLTGNRPESEWACWWLLAQPPSPPLLIVSVCAA